MESKSSKLYLVASPGRTGSQFLHNYLNNYFYTQKDPISKVTGTHDATLQLDKTTVVICCRRRNLWQHTLSSVIAHHYNEWTDYIKPDEDISIDLEIFENKYLWNLRWFEAFSYYTSYESIIDIFFEDFIDNHLHINQVLKFKPIQPQVTSQSSPHSKNRIKNLQELKLFFLKLENDVYLHTFPIFERCWNYKH